MTAKAPSVTPVPDGALEAVRARYYLSAIERAERLSGGLSNGLFLLGTGRRELVLQEPRPSLSAAEVPA